MCGIAGYLGAQPRNVLGRMAGAMSHRGPDGEGFWSADGVGLAHRRLAIIDCTEEAAQPMVSCDGRYHVVFNGEIYNFRQFEPELRRRGYVFNPRSDTAILGPMFDAYGPAMLHRLNGIFAFAIWDSTEKSLFVARDGLGIKPLYYGVPRQGLVFASEMKAVLQADGIDRTIDHAALRDYLVHLWSPGERTMLKGVRKLLPGHYLLTGPDRQPTFHRWYRAQAAQPRAAEAMPSPGQSPGARPEALLALLDQVVADQCLSDVPIGAFLSGGVDSTAVVASMLATGNRPAATYCVGQMGGGFEDDHAGLRVERRTAEADGDGDGLR